MSPPAVHVHLNAGRSPESWRWLVERRRVWDEDPYGYRALAGFYPLTYSADVHESRPTSLARRGLVKLLGLDLVHAWRNRSALQSADYVVTHTEHEFLAALLMLRICRDDRRKVICQAVWLWDRWPRLSRLRRWCYRRLMDRAAALTVLSTENLAVARRVGSPLPTVFVPYGVRPLPPVAPGLPLRAPIRILSVGNDVDRDWALLSAAAAHLPGTTVRVRSRRRAARRAFASNAASVRPSTSIDDFWSDLAWCDVVVVPLRSNLHASGVTVALEAVSAGRPVVVADVGGLKEYFEDAIFYYQEGDYASLVDAVRRAAAAGPVAEPGQGPDSLVVERGLRAIDYAHRHVLLIDALWEEKPVDPRVSRFATPSADGGHR